MLSIIGGSHKRGSANMQVKVDGEERTIRSCAKDLDEVSRSYGMPPPLVARHRRKLENLDADLRDIVARCCAAAPSDRPALEDLIAEVEHHVATKTEAAYAGKLYADQESDEFVSRIVKDIMINAKTDAEETGSQLPPFGTSSGLKTAKDLLGPSPGGFDMFRPPPQPGRLGGEGFGFRGVGFESGGGFGGGEGLRGEFGSGGGLGGRGAFGNEFGSGGPFGVGGLGLGPPGGGSSTPFGGGGSGLLGGGITGPSRSGGFGPSGDEYGRPSGGGTSDTLGFGAFGPPLGGPSGPSEPGDFRPPRQDDR